jgi:hypothetical protein
MGVDVGSWFHYEIDQWFLPDAGIPGTDLNIMSRCRVLKYGKVPRF